MAKLTVNGYNVPKERGRAAICAGVAHLRTMGTPRPATEVFEVMVRESGLNAGTAGWLTSPGSAKSPIGPIFQRQKLPNPAGRKVFHLTITPGAEGLADLLAESIQAFKDAEAARGKKFTAERLKVLNGTLTNLGIKIGDPVLFDKYTWDETGPEPYIFAGIDERFARVILKNGTDTAEIDNFDTQRIIKV